MHRPLARLIPLALIVATVPLGWAQDAPREPVPILPPPAPVPAGPGDGPGINVNDLFGPIQGKPLDPARIAGLPAGSKPAVLTWRQVYELALIHSHAEPPPRFATLDPVQTDEQCRALGFADFAKFRSHCLASPHFRDPASDFLMLQFHYRRVASADALVELDERLLTMMKELVQGESFGLGQVDIDLTAAALGTARRDLDTAISLYRDRLDAFKVTLGLAPSAPIILDTSSLALFGSGFNRIGNRSGHPNRQPDDLDRLVLRDLPAISDCPIDGRAVLAEVEQNPDRLESVLALATQKALTNRPPTGEPADTLEIRVRKRLRMLMGMRSSYAAEQRAMILSIRLAESAFEQIISPPQGAGPSRAISLLTASYLEQSRQVIEHRTRLFGLWTGFQAERLAFDRDLGPLPDADWGVFLGRFVARNDAGAIALPAEPAPPANVAPIRIPINRQSPAPPR